MFYLLYSSIEKISLRNLIAYDMPKSSYIIKNNYCYREYSSKFYRIYTKITIIYEFTPLSSNYLICFYNLAAS